QHRVSRSPASRARRRARAQGDDPLLSSRTSQRGGRAQRAVARGTDLLVIRGCDHGFAVASRTLACGVRASSGGAPAFSRDTLSVTWRGSLICRLDNFVETCASVLPGSASVLSLRNTSRLLVETADQGSAPRQNVIFPDTCRIRLSNVCFEY